MTTDQTIPAKRPLVLRILAQLVSYVFHPLFIPFYTIVFLIQFHPSYFAGFGAYDKFKLMSATALNTVFFPALSVLLMKGLGFIKSITLPERQDRIGPYLAAMIFYFWAAWVFFKFQPVPHPAIASFMTGVFITSIAGLLANIYFKISMHAMGVGGLLGFFLLIMKSNTMLMTWPLSLALLVAGLVCTARMLVSDHDSKDIYAGLLAGILCQWGAALVIL